MSSVPPIVVVVGRERPHEVALNVWGMVLGAALTAGAPRPGSLLEYVSGPAFYLFSAGLGLGGLVALIGSHWRGDIERGLDLERAGLLILSGALLVYFVAVVATFQWQALLTGGLIAAWTHANIRRSMMIGRDLRRVRRQFGDRPKGAR